MLQSVFGWQTHNEELTEFGAAPLSWPAYLTTGHFVESVFENWESEFLQMGAYVLLTAYLVQRGSAESKPLDQTDRAGGRPASAGDPAIALAGPRGGLLLRSTENSLPRRCC